ncbi:hypothetical protein GCM10010520_11130 [Rhizobium viscosum]
MPASSQGRRWARLSLPSVPTITRIRRADITPIRLATSTKAKRHACARFGAVGGLQEPSTGGDRTEEVDWTI